MENKIKRICIVALKTAILMVLTVAISAVCRFLFVDNMFGQEYFSKPILNACNMCFFLLIFNSLIFSLNSYNEKDRIKFWEYIEEQKSVSHIKFIVSSLDFYIEIICITIISLISPTSFLYGFVREAFFYSLDLTEFNLKLYTLLLILPVMTVLLFLAHIGIQKNWYRKFLKEKTHLSREEETKIPLTLKSIITVTAVYCVAAMGIPWLLPFFITLYNFGGPVLFLWILIGLAVSVLLAIAFFYVRAIFKRRSFVKKLKKYCKDNSLYLSNIRKPYASLFHTKDGFDFTVEKSGTKYDCKFIAGIFPSSQIVFSDKGNALKQDTVRLFKVELFHFMTKFGFGYESDGKKILVVLPIPKTFFVSTNESSPRCADIGEKIGEYTVYNSNGFLNALDRNCL